MFLIDLYLLLYIRAKIIKNEKLPPTCMLFKESHDDEL